MTQAMRLQPSISQLTRAAINISANGANNIVSSPIYGVWKMWFVVGSAGVGITFTGMDVAPPKITLTGNGSLTFEFDSEPWFVFTSGNSFGMTLDAAVQVSGLVYYT